MYKRICKKCNKEITYKTKKAFVLAEKKESNCFSCTIKRINKNQANYNVDFLLENKLISAYYLGLIIADGYLTKNRFEILLKKEDSILLLPDLSILCGGCPIYDKEIDSNLYERIGFNNKSSVEKVRNTFDLRDRKTYNSINFEVFIDYNEEYIKSLLIGIVDGDGTIYIDEKNKNPSIGITCHKNWEEFYLKLFNKLGYNPSITKVRKENLNIRLSRTNEIKDLFDFAEKNKLIKLTRKWNKLKNLQEIN